MIAAFAIYGGQHCAVHGAETGCVAGAGGKDGVGGGGALHAANYINRVCTRTATLARAAFFARDDMRFRACAMSGEDTSPPVIDERSSGSLYKSA